MFCWSVLCFVCVCCVLYVCVVFCTYGPPYPAEREQAAVYSGYIEVGLI